MKAIPPESAEHSLLQPALMLLSGLAGAALILALLAYSLVNVLGSKNQLVTGNGTPQPQTTNPSSVALGPSVSRYSSAWGPSEPLVFVLCDHEELDFAAGGVTISDVYILLRPETDRDLIVDLLAGTNSLLPKSSRIYHSACVSAGLKQGNFP